MSNPTDPKQEQLLLDLYRRLEWNVLHVDDDDFNPDEVKAIMQLLDILDPIEEDDYFQPEPALARFKERYHIDNNTEVSAELTGDVTDATKPDRKVVDIADRRTVAAERNEKRTTRVHSASKKRKRFKFSSPLGRIAAAIAAVIVLSFGLNIGSYAVADKPFMEVVSDGMNSLRISTRGNAEEEQVVVEEAPKVYYDSWEAAEEALEVDLLIPGYIPEGYELEEMYSQEYGSHTYVSSYYKNVELNKELLITIECYKEVISKRVNSLSNDWSFLEKRDNLYLYRNEDCYRVVFFEEYEKYKIDFSGDYVEINMIIEEMK